MTRDPIDRMLLAAAGDFHGLTVAEIKALEGPFLALLHELGGVACKAQHRIDELTRASREVLAEGDE
jgi:hypothetical protein